MLLGFFIFSTDRSGLISPVTMMSGNCTGDHFNNTGLDLCEVFDKVCFQEAQGQKFTGCCPNGANEGENG